MKINSKNLIHADQAIDRRGFGLSILSNWVDLSLKIGIKAWQLFCPERLQKARASNSNKHYWEYLENKSWSKCLILSIPIPGLTNWVAGLLDRYNSNKAAYLIDELHGQSLTEEQQKTKEWAKKIGYECHDFVLDALSKHKNPEHVFNRAAISLLYEEDVLKAAIRRMPGISDLPRFQALKQAALEYVESCQETVREEDFYRLYERQGF